MVVVVVVVVHLIGGCLVAFENSDAIYCTCFIFITFPR